MRAPTHRHEHRLGRLNVLLLATLLFALCWAKPSAAHVLMDTPKDNSTLAVGSTVVMTWEDLILHIGIGYDLDLVSANQVDVTPIVSGLSTSTHSYSWVVPNIVCVGCFLRVTQVNRDHDYESLVLVNIGMAPPGGSAGSGGAPGSAPGTGTSSAGAAGATIKPPAAGSGGSAGAAPQSSAGAGGGSAGSTSDAGSVGGAAVESSGGTGGAGSKQQAQHSSSSGAGDESADTAGATEDGSTAPTGVGAGSDGASPNAASSSGGGCSLNARTRRSSGFGLLLGCVAIALAGRRRRVARRAR